MQSSSTPPGCWNLICHNKGVNRFSNGEIAAQLTALAQYLTSRGENKFKVKAYRRAARTINTLGESIDEAVRDGRDLKAYPGIGDAISRTIQELVETGSLRQLQRLASEATPQTVEFAQYPRLDSRRALRIYKKLGIGSIAELKQKLQEGEIAAKLGVRMDQHVRQALNESHEMLLYEADRYVPSIQSFLLDRCGVRRAEPVGDYRRRVEVIHEIAFLIETNDLPAVTKQLEHLSSGPELKLLASTPERWGLDLIRYTGTPAHVNQLETRGALHAAATESGVYSSVGLPFIPPELRGGDDEIALAASGALPSVILEDDIRGELHAHSTSSDGVNTIEEMALAARDFGYQYIGMSDHSQSLKIAGGLSEERLWEQIRFIDKLNETLEGVRVLKSAEVDILADGSLDYPDELLKELDYTVCSIHSRFGMGKADQTDRILRAMESPYFNILGHATGRLLLKRPGYELDIDRVLEQARQRGCFFEMNSSPDRLDLSAENARYARQAGIRIAITTDAHSIHDFRYLKYGIEQARRAGLAKESILNHYAWPELRTMLCRRGG
jgi:DNA polymerase (family 10)